MKTIQRGFTIVETLLVILVATVVGFGGYYVWQNRHPKPAQTSSSASTASQQNPHKITFDEDFFTFQAPTGWARDARPDSHTYEYHDANNSLTIYNDLVGWKGIDITWYYNVKNSGNAVQYEDQHCAYDACKTDGNGKFVLGVVVLDSQGTEIEVKGHNYEFLFINNSQEENVDTTVYKDILTSFIAK